MAVTTKKPKGRRPGYISPQKQTRLKELANQGLPATTIAKVAGVSRFAAEKYLTITQARTVAVDQFKDNLSLLLHESLSTAMQLQSKVLISLAGEDLDSLSVAERKNLLSPLGTVTGILYDKIRLQDGKSTVNSSHRIQLESVHKTLYVDEDTSKQGHQVATTKGKTCAIMETDRVEATQPIDSIEITEDAT